MAGEVLGGESVNDEFHMELFGGPAVAVAEEFGVELAGLVFVGVIVDGDVLAAEEELEFFVQGALDGLEDGFSVGHADGEFASGFEDGVEVGEESFGFEVSEVLEEILGEDFIDGIGVPVLGEDTWVDELAFVGVDLGVPVDVDEVGDLVFAATEIELEGFHGGDEFWGRGFPKAIKREGFPCSNPIHGGPPPLFPLRGRGDPCGVQKGTIGVQGFTKNSVKTIEMK
jgi:hypothetical protein